MNAANKPRIFSRKLIAARLRALGVRRGGVLLVHTSYRAVRPVEGGPEGLIEALGNALGPEGTLVMPSWCASEDEPFDPDRTRVARDLGVVADTFWRQAGVKRTEHLFAFAARGPRAAEIVRDPLPIPPHIPESPIGLVHELDGRVLLLGVGHENNTTLHLAELLAGVPYRVPKSALIGREDASNGSSMARTTIAASASRSPTTGSARAGSRPKARSATRMRG
jgi:aminoglycoside N3'-acetyltransferase